MFVHHYSHILITVSFNQNYNLIFSQINTGLTYCIYDINLPFSIIAGPLSLLILAVISCVLLNIFPTNKFFASIGMITSSSRIGQSFILLVQMLIFRYKPTIVNDEWMFLSQIKFNDMSAAILILFIYTIILCFLFIISVRTYQARPIIKWSFVILTVIIQIPVNFFLTDNVNQFILKELN